MSDRPRRPATRLIHTRGGGRLQPTVNPPIERASTLLLPDVNALYAPGKTYGRMGLSVHRELEAGLCALEGANTARLAPSGLAACALAIASIAEAGDHVLVADNVYGPTRRFCERRLKAMGIEVTLISPRIGAEIVEAFRDNTVAIMLEAPGSLTFEICDTHAIVEAAHPHGIKVLMDNTWGAGVFFRPLDLGVDMSIQALTKYVVGHADAFGGAVMTRDANLTARIAATADDWGISLGPDDAYLCLRGLRTLPARLTQHQTSGFKVAEWLAAHPSVKTVLHPGLASHPDHALWQRDFTGACGLFGVELHPMPDLTMTAFFSALDLFGLGFSWGGYESLVIPCDRQLRRSQSPWTRSERGPLLRFHVGLEDPHDLIAELETAFTLLEA